MWHDARWPLSPIAATEHADDGRSVPSERAYRPLCLDERPRVLVVDDTAINRELVQAILEEDHEVLLADSGSVALERTREARPDIILLDVRMPEMDGYEVCRRLKADAETAGIPIIFVTSLSDEEDEAKGLLLGAIDYIHKPISAATLRARIRNHVELKRYRDFLSDLSMRDGLTGIANRRKFDDTLHVEWRRALRCGQPLGLILGDVDYFKAYNDHYGHLDGDRCLCRIARALESAVRRPGDLLARYGGEEFVLLLPNTDGAGTACVAEALRTAVLDATILSEVAPHGNQVTMSFGSGAIVPTHAAESPLHFITHVDRCLYEAKRAGKNRVVSSPVDAGARPASVASLAEPSHRR